SISSASCGTRFFCAPFSLPLETAFRLDASPSRVFGYDLRLPRFLRHVLALLLPPLAQPDLELPQLLRGAERQHFVARADRLLCIRIQDTRTLAVHADDL